MSKIKPTLTEAPEPSTRKTLVRNPILAAYKREARIKFDLAQNAVKHGLINDAHAAAVKALADNEAKLRAELEEVNSEIRSSSILKQLPL